MEFLGSLSDLRCGLGESPVWDAARACLFWCDTHDGAVHAHWPDSRRQAVWRFGETVGSLGLARSGRLVVALSRGVVLFDPERETQTRLADLGFATPRLRLNDGKVGPDGAFWVGSVHEVEFTAMQTIGALYRIAPDGTVACRVEGLKASNGLAWTGDGRTMFHSDSCGPWIDRWDFDPESGAMSGRRRIAQPQEADGRPDGGAADLEGNYWSAGTSAGVLNRYDREGNVLAKVVLPVPRPTMPCFGGEGMQSLFVTTRCDVLGDDERRRYPLAGSVLMLRSELAGVAPFRFAD